MTSFKCAFLAAVILAAPSLAQAGTSPSEKSATPCGWQGGAMSDPGQTQRCLAARFKAPKPKPDAAHRAQAPTEGTAAPQPNGGTGA